MEIRGNQKNLSPREQALIDGAVFVSPETNDSGWYFLQIQGEPYKRGFQHGFYLGREIYDYIARNFRALMFVTGKEPEFFFAAAERLWLDRIDGEFLTELQGIVDGMACRGRVENRELSVSLAQLLAWNGFYELYYSWWPMEFGRTANNFVPRQGPESCSAFIATGEVTRDNRTMIAHETWGFYFYGAAQKLILDILPDRGHHIFMQGCFGHIDSGSDFFLTGAGIMGTETTNGYFAGYDENKTPEFFRARKAMQYGESIDHWVNIMMEQNNGGYANSWLLGTHHDNGIVRFEQGLKHFNVERKSDGAYFGFNSASDLRVRNLECSWPQNYYDVRDCGGRRVRFIQLIGNLDKPLGLAVNDGDKNGEYYGRIDEDNAIRILGDHLDVYRQQQPGVYGEDECQNPCSRTLCGHFDNDPQCPPFNANLASFYPLGSLDGKVVTSDMAENMKFLAASGHPCGMDFDASEFIQKYPQYNWLEGIMHDMPSFPWVWCQSPEPGEEPVKKYK
jgi:hypothetical protein